MTASGEPILNILGDTVALGPLRRDLIDLYVRWVNDFESIRSLGATFRPRTAEEELAWYDQAHKDETRVMFLIYERATLRPIGSADLREIDHANRTAEFGIFIGEKECWGKGYGTETTRLLLEFAFHSLGLHNVLLKVDSVNERAIRAYTRAGFRVIGARRQARRLGTRVCDLIFMECLATECLATEFPGAAAVSAAPPANPSAAT